jgi:hypothetical protein
MPFFKTSSHLAFPPAHPTCNGAGEISWDKSREVLVALDPQSRNTKAPALRACLPALIVFLAVASSAQPPSSTAETKPPDLDLLLQSIEGVAHQNPAQARAYEVKREYKVFRGDNKQPVSEITAQINFVPPDMKTYKITQSSGSKRGEKIVRQILDRETESAKKTQGNEISRMNYDFVFLRHEDFGIVPEYVLLIVPKRKEKYLLRGQIWVDANTFRVRRIEGVPAKNPSFWITGIHLTLQFAELNGMWIPVSFDSIATVRLFGQYTLAGRNLEPPIVPSAASSH